MNVKIHPIKLGVGQAFVLEGERNIIIDAGNPKQSKKFIKGLNGVGIEPKSIDLMIITHGHWDHIGTAAEIKEMTGARLAMHEKERERLEKVIMAMPPGVNSWGRFLIGLTKLAAPSGDVFKPAAVDIVLTDDDYPLDEYGIPGRIIHTPGHTKGSVSVLLSSGEAFVGDLAMNMFPMRLTPGLPVFAEDFDQVISTWRKLLNENINRIFPAHGSPFGPDVIEKELRKLESR